MPRFNWQTATVGQVQERVDEALRKGRPMTVSPKWLKELLNEHVFLERQNEHLKAELAGRVEKDMTDRQRRINEALED